MTVRPLALWAIPVGDFGGVARHVVDVARTGIPGYRMVVLCPEGALAERLREAGTAVVTAAFGPDAGPLTSARTLRRTMGRLRPELVHTHLAYADILAAGVLARDRSVALVSTEHGISADAGVYHRSALKARATAAVHHARLRRVDEVIAVSQSTRDVMDRRWSPASPVTVIPNSVDRKAVQDVVGAPTPRRLGEGIRLLSLSRLAPEKRVDALLRAMPAILTEDPAATLTVAGTGPDQEELAALASELGIGAAVRFPGFVDPWEAMRDHDVVVQLSAWENLSYTLLDAVAAGLPVVATDVGGNREIVGPEALIGTATPNAIVRCLQRQGAAQSLPHPEVAPALGTTVQGMVRGIGEVYTRVLRLREAAGEPTSTAPERIHLIANQGEVGGGEVMLHHLAVAMRGLGRDVQVVAPAEPSEVADRLTADGFAVVRIPGEGRRRYAWGLRRWARHGATGVLWCNGLLPAAALTAVPRRVVHLHQQPQSRLQRMATSSARIGALATVVNSQFMGARFPGAAVLENWVEGPVSAQVTAPRVTSSPVTVGFIGRISADKGVLPLLAAVKTLQRSVPGRFVLQVAGEPRFVEAGEAERIDQEVENAGDSVVRLGWQETYTFLDSVDMLVCPSLWEESFGLVAAEAMAARVPVIVSDRGALPEVVGEDHPYITRAGDPSDLARAITDVAGLSAGAREELIQRQHRRWQTMWSPQAGRARLARLLQQLQDTTT